MTPKAAATIRDLLAQCDVQDAKAVAAHAAVSCELVSRHLARLVGELGVRALFERSLYLAGSTFPFLRAVNKSDTPYETLRLRLERETPEVAMNAGVHTLSTFVELLERFIGGRLVASLLHEVWPAYFPVAAKEPK